MIYLKVTFVLPILIESPCCSYII